jgi:hypothetical protein
MAPHIPKQEIPVSKPWPGFTDRDELASARWVFWTPAGWSLLRDTPLTAGRRAPALPINGRFIFVRPDDEIAIVLRGLGEVSEAGPGTYSASLAAETARLVSPPALLSPAMYRVKDATVRATFTVRDGQLAHYEIEIDVTFNERPLHRVLIRYLRDLGTTTIDVPAEVRGKLQQAGR